MREITEETYQSALEALTSITRAFIQIAETVDIAAMRTIVGRFEALAPVLEPTAYARGGGMNLRDQAAFLAAADRFASELRRLDKRPASTREDTDHA